MSDATPPCAPVFGPPLAGPKCPLSAEPPDSGVPAGLTQAQAADLQRQEAEQLTEVLLDRYRKMSLNHLGKAAFMKDRAVRIARNKSWVMSRDRRRMENELVKLLNKKVNQAISFIGDILTPIATVRLQEALEARKARERARREAAKAAAVEKAHNQPTRRLVAKVPLRPTPPPALAPRSTPAVSIKRTERPARWSRRKRSPLRVGASASTVAPAATPAVPTPPKLNDEELRRVVCDVLADLPPLKWKPVTRLT